MLTAMDEGTVWLVGMMGAGKSAVGRALAERLGRELVDTDARIVDAAGCSIPEIFEREGESGFRAREREAVSEVAGKPVVVSLGGGAPCQPGIVELLSRTGRIVYLRARLDTLLRRVGRGRGRPLLQGLGPEERRERLGELLEARSGAYQQAHVIVDTDDLDVAAAARRVAASLETDC